MLTFAYILKLCLIFRFQGLIRLAILSVFDLMMTDLLGWPPSSWALASFAVLSLRGQSDGAWDFRRVPGVIWIFLAIVPLWDRVSQVLGHPMTRIVHASIRWRWVLLGVAAIDTLVWLEVL